MKIKFCEFSVLKGHSGYMIQMESFLCVTLYALLFFFCEKRRILRLVLRPHRIARIWWPGSVEVGGSRVINSETNYRSRSDAIRPEPVGSLLLSSPADCRSHLGFSHPLAASSDCAVNQF